MLLSSSNLPRQAVPEDRVVIPVLNSTGAVQITKLEVQVWQFLGKRLWIELRKLCVRAKTLEAHSALICETPGTETRALKPELSHPNPHCSSDPLQPFQPSTAGVAREVLRERHGSELWGSRVQGLGVAGSGRKLGPQTLNLKP